MAYRSYFLLMMLILVLVGCRHCGIIEKRKSELNCPTDIRQMVPWCAGEDAVFYCPCGPSREFYGCKPTCWGAWPAPGAEWRNAFCGPPTPDYSQPSISQELLELPDPVLIETHETSVELNETATELNLDNTASERGPEIIPSKPASNNTIEPQKQESKNTDNIHQQIFIEADEDKKKKNEIRQNNTQENIKLIRQLNQENDDIPAYKKSAKLLNPNINPSGMLASFLQRQISQETDTSNLRAKATEK